MRSFEGQYASRKKVDLRGRSRVEESREQILQRTREERERRRQQKLEQKSASTIQATWRSSRATERARNDMRDTWERLYGAEGDLLDSAHIQLGSSAIRELTFFARPSNKHDVQKVANAGKALQQSQAASPAVSKEEAAVLVLRGKRLAALSMRALADQCSSRAQQQNTANLQHATQESLVSCIQAFTGVALWKQQGVASAHEAAASVLDKLADQLPELSGALLATERVQPDAADQSALDSPVSRLMSSLVSQTLGLRAPQALMQMPHLLFVPLLWQRYTSLRPLQPALWQTALESLASSEQGNSLGQWLRPQDSSKQSRTERAAILLGNLVEAAGPSLQGQSSAAERTPMALAFLKVVQTLLQEVQQSLSRGDTAMDLDEDEEQAMGPLSSQAASLLGPGSEALAGKVARQIEGLASEDVLKPLIQALLPYAQNETPALAVEDPDRLSVTYKLCELLDTMMDVAPLRQNTLIVLAVPAELVPRLWYSALKEAWAFSGRWKPVHDDRHDPGWMMPLVVLSRVYTTYLSTFGDNYMYQLQKPLPLAELYSPRRNEGLISLLKYALWQVLWVETQPASRGWTGQAAALRDKLKSSVSGVLGQLNSRNSRRPFAPASAFQTEDLSPARFHAEVKSAAASLGGLMEATHTRVWAILTHAPFLIAFEERAQVFQTVITADRSRRREMGAYGPQSFVTIHRDTLMQDALERLGQMDEELRSRIRIQYVDSYGEVEAGVDGGGLFKDFMENLVKEGFNPEVGLFRTTPEQKLYPNPAASSAVPNARELFGFLGKMLGKAMYEGILLELPLASFFLKKLLHMGCDLHDLPSLDAELYKSLLFLRDYEGDVDDLALSFTVTDGALGENKEIELVPGGKERSVTSSSRLEYILRVANYKLNYQPKLAADAFRTGLEKVIPHEWLRMFSEVELQALIGGGDHQGLDLADMRSHVNYAGGYHEDHPVIKGFWQALESFMPDQQKAFLRFVTACSRPPLLGFKYLDPALCVQMAGGVLDEGAQERLPSSSTCINLLKLPPYKSAEAVRSKLLFAIKNVAGFDLS